MKCRCDRWGGGSVPTLAAMPRLVDPVVLPGTWGSLPQPTIVGEGLTLRPWVSLDAQVLEQTYADPVIQQWHVRSLTFGEAHEWISERKRRWATETAADWAVTVEGQVAGRVGFCGINLAEGRAEVSYWTGLQHRGQGISPRALDALTEWATTTGRLHRLELEHAVSNQASCRVARRCGYAAEGTAVRSVLHADGWHDMHLHGYTSMT